jgi:cell envelope opacity-associated protein A
MPGRFELKPTLAKIWQAPDNFRIMDPLPSLHRKGIIIGALLVILGFLLPSGGDNSDTAPVARNAQLDIQSQAQPQPDPQPMQTQLVTHLTIRARSLPLSQSQYRTNNRRIRHRLLNNPKPRLSNRQVSSSNGVRIV